MGIEKSKAIFLLGGRDLEMLTIKKILKEQGFKKNINYFDKKLHWGAKLSDYAEVIAQNTDKMIYAVELTEDMETLPKNYVRIDHHNDFSHKEASLLQVLSLLDVKPSREQKLIAANDVNHIEGMRCECASEEEIADIRKKERSVQGITQEDEERAREELKNIQVVNGVHVLKSSLSSFVAIGDFCKQRPLLVYSDKALIYYGNISMLKKAYEKQIENKEAFHGKHYFGFDSTYLSTTNIEALVNNVVEVVTQERFISYHAFMFPFSFNKASADDGLNNRIAINKGFHEQLSKADWEYKKFNLEASNDTRMYNEYSYFTKPIRETLYNLKENFEEGETSYYYVKKVDNESRYVIRLIDGTEYELNLTDVYLRLFETGVGILVFEMENHKYENFEDILKINEYGRRVYPQFLDGSCANYTTSTKKAFLADSITVKISETQQYSEDFSKAYQEKIPSDIIIGKHITDVLGEGCCHIKPVLDDRMFVLSYIENESLLDCLKHDDENFKTNDDWYRYLFVDGGSKTVQYLPMQKELAEMSTYPRWLGWGTLWGVTRYSFVALTTEHGRGMILPHAQYHYHQMSVLILATHASLARFRDEVSELSSLKKGNDLEGKVQILYEYYIKFVNKLYFRDLTSQDQGIELYAIAKKVLNFDKEMKDLDDEISELHTYVQMKAEAARNDRLETISKLGAVFLPPSLIAGIFGMNVFGFEQSWVSMSIVFLLMSLSAVAGLFMVSSKDEKKEKRKLVYFGIIFIGLLVGSIYAIGENKKPQDVHVVEIDKYKVDETSITKIQSYLSNVITTYLKKEKKNVDTNQTKKGAL